MNLKGVGGIKVFLTEEAEKMVFPLIINGKPVMHSPRTLLEVAKKYDDALAVYKHKLVFWQGFGVTMTLGSLVFAKKWIDAKQKIDILDDELLDLDKKYEDLWEDDEDINEEEYDGENAS